jgi:hypothetical protein
MKELTQHILSNGFIFFIPILLLNIALTKKLPPPFGTQAFDANIPKAILFGEGVFRMLFLSMSLTININLVTVFGSDGFKVFSAGVLIYFASWIALILFPGSKWSKDAIGFSAPAYSPIIWLVGFALMGDSFYFNLKYSIWYYIIPSLIFTGFHLSHTIIAYNNFRRRPTVSGIV